MSMTNQITSGNRGTNGSWQMAVINLLREIARIVNPDDFRYVSDQITDDEFHELIPATADKQAIITDMLVTNGHATIGTWIEFRESSATGAILWKGFARADGGGWIQPDMFHGIVADKGKSVGFICLTDGADVVVNVTGHKKKP